VVPIGLLDTKTKEFGMPKPATTNFKLSKLMDEQVIGQIRVNKSATFLYHNTSKSVSLPEKAL
jgi:hypothetical protein